MRSSLMYRSAGSTFLVDASEDRMDCGRGRPDMVAVTERPQSSVGRCCNQPAQRTSVFTHVPLAQRLPRICTHGGSRRRTAACV